MNDPDLEDLREDISNTRLSDVIERNTRIDNVPDNVFFVSEIKNNNLRTDNQITFAYVAVFLIVVFAIYAQQKSSRISR